MLKQKEVNQAVGVALTNIKRKKRMRDVKYPLVNRVGWRTYFYFTNADGAYYTQIVKACLSRKGNKVIEADKLFCFEYDHKRDGWFIEDIPELTDYVEELFWEFYDKYVAPEWEKEKI